MIKTVKKVAPAKRMTTLIDPKERLKVWQRARGMWKGRKPDPIRELAKIRHEWDRPLPKLKK